jgi:hypothetical protein
VFHRIYVWPYPDLPGRSPTFIVGEAGKVSTTEELTDIVGQLKAIPDLALVVVDPLSAFAGVDLSTPALGQAVGNILDKMAKELGCTVIAPHHLTKGSRDQPIQTVAHARQAVMGAAQLLNAVRFVYALWAPGEDYEHNVLRTIGRPPANNAVFCGAIVKANSNASRDMETFVRDENSGLLGVIPYKRMLAEGYDKAGVPHDVGAMVQHAIAHFVSECKPPMKTWLYRAQDGNKLTGQWFALMPEPWRELPRASLAATLNKMVDGGLLCVTKKGYLHLPGDQFATGAMTEADILDGRPTPVPWPIEP